ncbi:MAG: M16 family metallopeptidase [Lutispora sp.]|jgi:predicted Zn-dependent peptidase|uniref:M16 family metallopeptidase n=1 Tax=Lutispora sp. TaxID=2828727 RepID=UPI0035652901
MYIKHKLDNGVRIVAEEIKYVNSVSIGIWVKVGSRNEDESNNGMSHFIEHMLFKGTKNRTAKEIAGSIDKIGGQLNAFTSKECTCFYAKVLDTHFDIALDILSDMFFNSSFSENEIEKEKGVVLEEIGMYEDSPEDLVHDIFTQSVWSKNSLGMPILGKDETLKAFKRQDIIDYIDRNYTPENIVISVVGNFEKEYVLSEIEKVFSKHKTSKKDRVITPEPVFTPIYKHKEKNTEQAHLCLGFKGFELSNKYTYPLLVLNNIFGGAMSSRLFQKIREEQGLAYSVFSYPSSYTDCGLLSIYAGMKPNQLDYVIELIIEEINKIKANGISEDELYDSKEQIKGSYILGLESTSGRMNSIGKSELLLDKIYSPKEITELIDAVTMDDINHVIKLVFNTEEMGAAIIGPNRSTILK